MTPEQMRAELRDAWIAVRRVHDAMPTESRAGIKLAMRMATDALLVIGRAVDALPGRRAAR